MLFAQALHHQVPLRPALLLSRSSGRRGDHLRGGPVQLPASPARE